MYLNEITNDIITYVTRALETNDLNMIEEARHELPDPNDCLSEEVAETICNLEALLDAAENSIN